MRCIIKNSIVWSQSGTCPSTADDASRDRNVNQHYVTAQANRAIIQIILINVSFKKLQIFNQNTAFFIEGHAYKCSIDE